MYICRETRKPMDLTYANRLIIDRKRPENDFMNPFPTICLSLDGTLFRKFNPTEATELPQDWLVDAVSVECGEGSQKEKTIVVPRPGAADLLVELDKYACPMIYSSQPTEFIEAALLQLSIAQTDSDRCTDAEYERSEAYFDKYIWSRDQCVDEPVGYIKLLGTLSEFSDNGINDIWLIDHRSDLVDFPSHVISVSKFAGDPADRELYRIADQIFAN